MAMANAQAMIEPIPKHKSPANSNRGQWSRFRKDYLDKIEMWGGWFECSKCKKWLKREDIELHHLIKRSQSKADVYNPENIIPVCNDCHRKLEGRL